MGRGGVLDMRANRISANAQYGVSVAGGVCRLKANVIYGNEGGGLLLDDVIEAHALGNCLARGGGEALVVRGARRKTVWQDVAGNCGAHGNLVELDPAPATRTPRATAFHDLVMHSLHVLEDWDRLRAGCLVIQTLGETWHVAVPASKELKALQLPSAAPLRTRAPSSKEHTLSAASL